MDIESNFANLICSYMIKIHFCGEAAALCYGLAGLLHSTRLHVQYAFVGFHFMFIFVTRFLRV